MHVVYASPLYMVFRSKLQAAAQLMPDNLAIIVMSR